jgi:4-hydroxy-tetrahydrodipicolinate synthase
MHEMIAAARSGETARAVSINNRLLGLHRHLFVEANPIPVKWALARMGRIAEGIRLPLTPLAAAHHETVAGALRAAGCLA